MSQRQPFTGGRERIRRVLLALLMAGAAGPLPAGAQTGDVVGRVRDQAQRPVIGAGVVLAGTAHYGATDSTGTFRLAGVRPGTYTLEVRHIAYGMRTVQLPVPAGPGTLLELSMTETAIQLKTLEVTALSAEERRDRGAGTSRSTVTRAQLAVGEDRSLTLPDMLRQASPTLQVRRSDRGVGVPVCVELRTVHQLRTRGTECHSPAVYLDGVPISNPSSLYDNIDLNTIESVEIVQAGEANVLFGPLALYGAILITTRRPGSGTETERAARLATRKNFDWSTEQRGHQTVRVAVTSTLANGAGLALGYAAASQCLGLRKPGYDRLVSDCGTGTSIGSGVAAIILPALASGVVSGLAGRTDHSRGLVAPATVGAGMAILPGYALVMSGYRNDSDALKWTGYGVLALGAPLMATAADYLFRKLRD